MLLFYKKQHYLVTFRSPPFLPPPNTKYPIPQFHTTPPSPSPPMLQRKVRKRRDAVSIRLLLLLICSAFTDADTVHKVERLGSLFSHYEGTQFDSVVPQFEFIPLVNKPNQPSHVQLIPPGSPTIELRTKENAPVMPPTSLDIPAQGSLDPALKQFVRFTSREDTMLLLSEYPGMSVYLVELHSYSPYVVYIVERSTVVNGSAVRVVHECDAVLAAAGGIDMVCGEYDVLAQRITPQVRFGHYFVGDTVHIRFTMATGLAAEWARGYLSIAVHRLHMLDAMEETSYTIKDSNDARSRHSRLMTGVIFFFVAVGMFAWSLLFALMFSWALPMLPVPNKCFRFTSLHNAAGKVCISHFPFSHSVQHAFCYRRLFLNLIVLPLDLYLFNDKPHFFVQVKYNNLIISVVAVVLNFSLSAAGGFTGWYADTDTHLGPYPSQRITPILVIKHYCFTSEERPTFFFFLLLK